MGRTSRTAMSSHHREERSTHTHTHTGSFYRTDQSWQAGSWGKVCFRSRRYTPNLGRPDTSAHSSLVLSIQTEHHNRKQEAGSRSTMQACMCGATLTPDKIVFFGFFFKETLLGSEGHSVRNRALLRFPWAIPGRERFR